MRNPITRATLVAALLVLGTAPSAMAAQNSGGAAVGGSSAKTESTGAATKTQSTDPTGAPATPDASATAADPIVTQTVKLTASQTKSVQRRVKVKADGAMGSKTRTAIKKYQRVQSLTLTGSPNVETLRSMKLKIADKIEAKLRAAATGEAADVTNQTVALSAPTGSSGEALTAARTAIGTPYKNAGTTLSGFDCSGLTQWAFGQAGVKIPRTSFEQYKIGTTVPKDQIQPGDLVFFDSNGAGASHVGIAATPTTVISATTRGVMEHDISKGYWAGHYVGAKRLADGDTAVKAAAARK